MMNTLKLCGSRMTVEVNLNNMTIVKRRDYKVPKIIAKLGARGTRAVIIGPLLRDTLNDSQVQEARKAILDLRARIQAGEEAGGLVPALGGAVEKVAQGARGGRQFLAGSAEVDVGPLQGGLALAHGHLDAETLRAAGRGHQRRVAAKLLAEQPRPLPVGEDHQQLEGGGENADQHPPARPAATARPASGHSSSTSPRARSMLCWNTQPETSAKMNSTATTVSQMRRYSDLTGCSGAVASSASHSASCLRAKT